MEQFPLYIAPNLITIVGLFINIVTSLLLVHYSPYVDQEVPHWARLLTCVGLFVYQSMDAIDSKPHGHLLYAGGAVRPRLFVSISVCCAVQLGTAPYWLFCQCLMAVTLFYCAPEPAFLQWHQVPNGLRSQYTKLQTNKKIICILEVTDKFL